MKLYISFCFVFTLLLISCSTNNVEDINYKNLFPTKVANNWVYQVTLLDTNAKITSENSKDSLAIISQKEIDGRKSYLLAFYRTNGAIDSAFVFTNENEILLFNRNLKPFHSLAQYDSCYCSKDKWIKIFSDRNKNWEQTDSIDSEYFPYKIPGKNEVEFINLTNSLESKIYMLSDTTIEFNKKKYIGKKVKINSSQIKRMPDSSNITFVIQPEFKYSDNYKTMYYIETEINLTMVDGIGIVYIEEVIRRGIEILHHKYNLLKYELH